MVYFVRADTKMDEPDRFLSGEFLGLLFYFVDPLVDLLAADVKDGFVVDTVFEAFLWGDGFYELLCWVGEAVAESTVASEVDDGVVGLVGRRKVGGCRRRYRV